MQKMSLAVYDRWCECGAWIRATKTVVNMWQRDHFHLTGHSWFEGGEAWGIRIYRYPFNNQESVWD